MLDLDRVAGAPDDAVEGAPHLSVAVRHEVVVRRRHQLPLGTPEQGGQALVDPDESGRKGSACPCRSRRPRTAPGIAPGAPPALAPSPPPLPFPRVPCRGPPRGRATRLSSEVDFSKNAAAPSSMVRSARPSSEKPLNITTRVSGLHSRTCGSASSPSIPGIETSRSSSSGRCCFARPMASCPVAPSATTSSRPDSRKQVRTSVRISAESSTTTTAGMGVMDSNYWAVQPVLHSNQPPPDLHPRIGVYRSSPALPNCWQLRGTPVHEINAPANQTSRLRRAVQ